MTNSSLPNLNIGSRLRSRRISRASIDIVVMRRETLPQVLGKFLNMRLAQHRRIFVIASQRPRVDFGGKLPPPKLSIVDSIERLFSAPKKP